MNRTLSACTADFSESKTSIATTSSDFAERAVELQVITLQEDDDCTLFEEEMVLKDSLKTQNFKEIKMRQISFGLNGKIYADKKVMSADVMIKQNAGSCGCIIFVIRRPGCVFCREEALTLKILAQKYPELLHGFKIIGIIKEFDADPEGLTELYEQYFPFPIYYDESLSFYEAFGRRRVTLTGAIALANPFGTVMHRISKKKIRGNFAGEGFIQGGVIICDKSAKPRFMYEEETGLDFPVDFVVKALNTIRGRKGS